MLGIWIGVLLVVGGVVYLAGQAIWRGRLSGEGRTAAGTGTLEPPAQGVGFLGLGRNWPGLAAILLGAALLLFAGFL